MPLGKIKAALESDEFIAAHRVSSTDFTRRSTLTFAILVSSLARGMLRSQQGELDDFFACLGDQANLVRAVSKSAFSQARKKLNPSAFRVSAIAERTGHDRKTVRKYIREGLVTPKYKPRHPRPTVIEPYEAYLRERVTAWPQLTGEQLLREVRAQGYRGVELP